METSPQTKEEKVRAHRKEMYKHMQDVQTANLMLYTRLSYEDVMKMPAHIADILLEQMHARSQS